MVETPIILPNIRPFDATKDYSLKFYINTDYQILENHLIVEDNMGREVYNMSQHSYVYHHIIPAYTLENGMNYKAKIKVRASQKGWSEFSGFELFDCLSPAEVMITTIDYDDGNKVYNQNLTFESKFTQKEGDTPAKYRYKLYDDTKTLIRAYDEQVYNGSLSQYVEDLRDSYNYYIEIIVESNARAITNSGLIPFTPKYEKTSLSAVLEPKPVPKEGAIEVKSRLTQIKGKVYDNNNNLIAEEDVEYVDDEYLDLNRYDYDRLVFDEGLLYDDDSYTVKIWLKNIVETTPYKKPLFKAFGSGGTTELYFYNNKFHVFKYSKDSVNVAHYASNEVDDSSSYMVQFSSNMGYVDILAKEV